MRDSTDTQETSVEPIGGAPRDAASLVAMAAAAKAVTVGRRERVAILNDCVEIGKRLGKRGTYAFTFKNRKGADNEITGPTTSLAELVAQAYGGCIYGSNLTGESETHYTLTSFFIDVVHGTGRSMPFRQPKQTSATRQAFKNDPDRGETTTLAIGDAKATRRVIHKCLEEYVDVAHQHALTSQTSSGRKSASKASAALPWASLWKRAQALGITRTQLWEFLGRHAQLVSGKKLAEQPHLTGEDFDRLEQAIVVIEDGMADLAEIFGDPNATEPDGSR